MADERTEGRRRGARLRRVGRRLRLVLLAGAALAGCRDALAPPLPGEGPPAAFRLSLAGFGYGSHEVTLSGDTLVIVRVPNWRPDSARAARVVPSREAWAAFWAAAEAAGVRSWPRDCIDRNIVDGGGFSLTLSYEGGHIEASGANAYPRRDGTCTSGAESSQEYRDFLAAVGALLAPGYTFP